MNAQTPPYVVPATKPPLKKNKKGKLWVVIGVVIGVIIAIDIHISTSFWFWSC